MTSWKLGAVMKSARAGVAADTSPYSSIMGSPAGSVGGATGAALRCPRPLPQAGTDQSEMHQLKTFLHNKFKIKDLGKLHYFLGLEVLYMADGVIISQMKFVLELLKEYDCLEYSTLTSPLDPNVKLRAKRDVPLTYPTYYRKLVGKLNFLTNTRLDIAFSVQHLSQFMQDPREPHLKAAFHMLRYLKTDPTLGVFLPSDTDWSIKAYCDSD
uniref:Uncharacterized mitochondrial protein AtMg00810-like n=1 Tax=Nicotiana tabacum TaxID=4097 RepID=A0A1S3ZN39_TOBAC|nr:PREDICTED: uncharacterized mitochondrial protein AtMg00810-like [Nicotiana tabacum]